MNATLGGHVDCQISAPNVMGEFYGLHYQKAFGVDFRALRLTTLYGLGKSAGSTGICSLLIEKAARSEPVMADAAEAVTDWLYIKDALNSFLLAHKIDSPKNRIFNIGEDRTACAKSPPW